MARESALWRAHLFRAELLGLSYDVGRENLWGPNNRSGSLPLVFVV
jgi:hypothetical protein